MSQTDEIAQLTWRSRRGLLELDMILLPFVQNHYHALSADEKSTFKQLLSLPDPELFAYFMQQNIPENPQIAALVSKIILLVNSKA